MNTETSLVPQTSEKVAWALWAAGQGFWIHPLRIKGEKYLARVADKLVEKIAVGKEPRLDYWQKRATRDPRQIEKWWAENPDYNIGYYTGKFGDQGESLYVIDVDTKHDGHLTLFQLELDGRDFPNTYTQKTPSGGSHFIYRSKLPLRQSQHKLGRGIDTRAKGGNLVGAGSTISGKAYTFRGGSLCYVPQWLADLSPPERKPTKKTVSDKAALAQIDEGYAQRRAVEYLRGLDTAVIGERNDQLFRAAAKLRDFGIAEDKCFSLLSEFWAHEGDVEPEKLKEIAGNAYRYSEKELGSDAPERVFTEIDTKINTATAHPFDKFNKDFAFVLTGGGHHILWETVDPTGRPKLEHLKEDSFHKRFAALQIEQKGKIKQWSKLWMYSPDRRSYDGLCFKPDGGIGPEWYNLWRGFDMEPVEKANHPALDAFLEHARENVCHGNQENFRWLIGYFAHLVQHPGKKPQTALVFQGKKGAGKSALIDRIGDLLPRHYRSVSHRRYLIGNFNSHLENCLLLKLEEAFWSGDNDADSILKDLITGRVHNIERKGQEPYEVDNLTRFCIIGNEDWIVPATDGERRYAVFKVGDKRLKDYEFFEKMRIGMEEGGYAHLLRYLMDFDLTGLNLNKAPETDALHEQKLFTIDPFHQWWHECLVEGRLLYGDFEEDWPETARTDRIRDAYFAYRKSRQIKQRAPAAHSIGRLFFRCLPKLRVKRCREGNHLFQAYVFPDITTARAEWDTFIGHKKDWDAVT